MLTGALKSLFAAVRGLPRPQGQPELPQPAGGADRHRGPASPTPGSSTTTRSTRYNTKIQTLPGQRASPGMFHFTEREYFEADDDVAGPRQGPFLDWSQLCSPGVLAVRPGHRRTSAVLRCSIAGFVAVRRRWSASASTTCSAVGSFGVVIALVRRARRRRSASYWNSDKVALRDEPGPARRSEQYARLHNLVEGLCIASGPAQARGCTSSTTPRPTPSPPAATPSTRRSRSPPGCSRR